MARQQSEPHQGGQSGRRPGQTADPRQAARSSPWGRLERIAGQGRAGVVLRLCWLTGLQLLSKSAAELTVAAFGNKRALGVCATRAASAKDGSAAQTGAGSTAREIPSSCGCASPAAGGMGQRRRQASPPAEPCPGERRTAASSHPRELQRFTHPKTGVLVCAEPLSRFRALFVFVQYRS